MNTVRGLTLSSLYGARSRPFKPTTPSKYSITVNIDDKTLEGLKSLKRTLALVRDLNVDGQLQNGNIVLATTEAKDLKTSQKFTWEETYEVYATQVGFKVSLCILFILMFRSSDDWHMLGRLPSQ